MQNDVVELGRAVIVVDDYGNQTKEYQFRDVFCELKSVGQQEFYTSAQAGLRPSFKIVLADYYEYDDEPVIRYNGRIYDVIRTYRNDLTIELTVQPKVGETV